jgi:hypothetical protein
MDGGDVYCGGCLVLVDDPNILLFLLYETYGAGDFIPAQTKIEVKAGNALFSRAMSLSNKNLKYHLCEQ